MIKYDILFSIRHLGFPYLLHFSFLLFSDFIMCGQSKCVTQRLARRVPTLAVLYFHIEYVLYLRF